jgi:hypothetical protein
LAEEIRRDFLISSRTRDVAVAVRAAQAASGNMERNSINCRYSGRKSCPHSDMQCASSTAKQSTFNDDSRANVLVANSASGAM